MACDLETARLTNCSSIFPCCSYARDVLSSQCLQHQRAASIIAALVLYQPHWCRNLDDNDNVDYNDVTIIWSTLTPEVLL